MIRDRRCGEVREGDVGRHVRCAGWVFRRRDHGGLIFVDLRDRSGVVQVVFSPEVSPDSHRHAHDLRAEYVVAVSGEVRLRPGGTQNQNLLTGAVEIYAETLTVLNESALLPFAMEEAAEASEALRYRHRFLDLRRPELQHNLIMRHRITKAIRDYLDAEGFLDIETPILTKSTPEGARDYLVPSRLNPGQFYALPQSPQLFKQILMVAGFDRYFQIARCFRDEDLRADRQPEFTQVDLEMSFVEMDDIMALIEGMVKKLFSEMLGIALEIPFERLSYLEAMERYGNDKPDVRFGLELKDIADIAARASFKVFHDALATGGRVKALNAKGLASLSRKEIDMLTEEAKTFGAKGLAWIKMRNGFESPISKFFGQEVLEDMARRLEADEGDLLLFVADREKIVHDVLSRMRLSLADKIQMERSGFRFLWVVKFPLLEWDEEEQRFVAMHHPFTSPLDEDVANLLACSLEAAGGSSREMLGALTAKAYDLVLNGNEIGGGSIRIHRPDVQRRMFEVLGISEGEAREKFGFLLDAFQFGAPPHGGIALGLDRLVMLMLGAHSIRDVVAFPKTQKAVCLMSGAPSLVAPKQLKELRVKVEIS